MASLGDNLILSSKSCSKTVCPPHPAAGGGSARVGQAVKTWSLLIVLSASVDLEQWMT